LRLTIFDRTVRQGISAKGAMDWLTSEDRRLTQELYSETAMRNMLRFLWNATRGHRLTPWRSPYLLWRVETYCGVKMQQIGFLEFWEFMWRERGNLWRFLKWTGEIDRYVHPGPKRP
jgi:hypothetical protein